MGINVINVPSHYNNRIRCFAAKTITFKCFYEPYMRMAALQCLLKFTKQARRNPAHHMSIARKF